MAGLVEWMSSKIYASDNSKGENLRIRVNIMVAADAVNFLFMVVTGSHILMPLSFIVSTFGWLWLFCGMDWEDCKHICGGSVTIILGIIVAGLAALKEHSIMDYMVVEVTSLMVILLPALLEPGGVLYERISMSERPTLPGEVSMAIAVEMI
uniref:Uncharacterized protein n=1 Tax=Attheya septentrionalis TaxID=420275 RepID=A0A7S2UQX5_9STRA|mmetsp:Transcript_8687/g.15743  ORF Transcript_8687/g.15743 Transcript_8687/m.15743 type:complete len:152 (+) Transcript_8687:297-752(+)|eukprot:CAMPEP_0198280146 /NCGR_PEP_ID=MMETSP1449-20131203/290_1 /TAXON_ID=420275 /ORGANISM="Attheya septentrionalis, Strain CCMP2084" /LENGTH=151 /DNA_ID=CAMNT_0043975429 /DNA_START=246 /DNA_END=701 /DNA_ORIENTATION=+